MQIPATQTSPGVVQSLSTVQLPSTGAEASVASGGVVVVWSNSNVHIREETIYMSKV